MGQQHKSPRSNSARFQKKESHAELSTRSCPSVCVCVCVTIIWHFHSIITTQPPLIPYRKLENSTRSLCHMTAALSAKNVHSVLSIPEWFPHTHIKKGLHTHTHTHTHTRCLQPLILELPRSGCHGNCRLMWPPGDTWRLQEGFNSGLCLRFSEPKIWNHI